MTGLIMNANLHQTNVFFNPYTDWIRNAIPRSDTTGKLHSFTDSFKFIDTDEYIQIIFVGFGIDECNVVFVGLGQEPTNIWVIRYGFDRPHIFDGDMATDEYMGSFFFISTTILAHLRARLPSHRM
jgi:hypothetical protein